MGLSRFAKFAWGLLVYNVAVIGLGAFVRASYSGDGCGNHWPNCGDSLIPTGASAGKTWVEFAHRASTAILLPIVIVFVVLAYRMFAKGNPVRKGATAALFFTIVEAGIGAVLVKNSLTGADASVFRAIIFCAHLITTFLLLGSITLTAAWASGVQRLKVQGQGAVAWAIGIAAIAMFVLGVSGGIAALGDTLFRAESLSAGLKHDFMPTAHFLEKLRPFHPMIAISVGILLVLLGGLLSHFRPSKIVKKSAQVVTLIFAVELLVGLVNLLLNAPIPMQLFHLGVADILWIVFVLMACSALAENVEQVEAPAAPEAEIREPVGIKDYIVLTKPRVISLLLFTTLTALFAAAGGWPGLTLLIAVTIGGYMSAGAANAINMVIDRDIDGTMKRTAKRPTVTQKISSKNALLFGFGLEAGSFAILWGFANFLSAMMALSGLVFYVVVYTLILKRRTWHNIVIGGAAGAFPPLVGWTAYTNQISPLAWILFAIIFVWTPVHFWALALLIKDDYAKANVPMLPVVRGERVTAIQICLYGVLTTIVSFLPFAEPRVGWIYCGVAMLLNLVLLVRCAQLFLKTERPQAVSLYKYSMLYLALLFLTFAIDRSWLK